MIRYLLIGMTSALLGLTLWLPGGYPAASFYHAAQQDHAANEQMWSSRFTITALRSALAAAETQATPSPANIGTDPAGVAGEVLGIRVRDFVDRLRHTSYLRALDAMMLLARYRLATLAYLAPAVVILLLPALVDAAIRRIIRTHEFRRHDPERFAFAIAGVLLQSGALVAHCALPVHVPPMAPVGLMLGIIYCLHVALSNYHHSGI